MTLSYWELFSLFRWIPIRNCPGRSVLSEPSKSLTKELTRSPTMKKYRFENTRDLVMICSIEGGGLISFVRSDQTVVHTLNTREGFHRRLVKFGLDEDQIAELSKND